MLKKDPANIPNPAKPIRIIQNQLIKPILHTGQQNLPTRQIRRIRTYNLLVPHLDNLILYLEVELNLVLKHTGELVPEWMYGQLFWGLVQRVLELLLDLVVVSVVDDCVRG